MPSSLRNRQWALGRLSPAPSGESDINAVSPCPTSLQDLANHAASLNSTRGAAFGFASIAKLAGEQLKPYVDKVVPKLYRLVNSLAPSLYCNLTSHPRSVLYKTAASSKPIACTSLVCEPAVVQNDSTSPSIIGH